MCGIVGYVGEQAGLDVVLEGLRRLEYRGYDSAGVAVLDGEGVLRVERRAGKLANLEKRLGELPPLPGTLAIGHTRWATHGPPTDRNAHPHVDCAGDVAVVHNGTIENFEELVEGLLARGHARSSDTDTEVVAHLVEERFTAGPTAGDLAATVRGICRDLEGSFVLVVTHRACPTSSSPPAATCRWSSASGRGRTSSGPTSRRSSPTPVRPGRSGRTRSSSCGATAWW